MPNSLKANTKEKGMTPHHIKKHADLDPEAPRDPAQQKDPKKARVETEAESAQQTKRKLGDGAGRVPMTHTAGDGKRTGPTRMTRTAEGERAVGSRERDHVRIVAESGSHVLMVSTVRVSRRKERSPGRMERKNHYRHPHQFHHLFNPLMRVQREKWKHKCRKVSRTNDRINVRCFRADRIGKTRRL